MNATGADVAVLVLSCDRYADLWAPFLRQFRLHFPADEFPVYVGSNERPCTEPGIRAVLSGPDADWSSSFRRILEQVPHRKLMVILEDLLLAQPVDRELLDCALSLLAREDALHVKYWGGTVPIDAPTSDPRVGVYARGAPYRATVCGFWDRDYLVRLLVDGESPWNFEIMGSYRTSYADRFYGLTRPMCVVYNMVEKGRWIPASLQWALSQRNPVQAASRPALEGSGHFASSLKMAIFRTMTRIPWGWRVKLMNKLRLLLVSY